ncbi:NUDIX hydrolase [Mesorhizobium sp. LHD-90]|uniref:NUDIX hydrolase n=1 Tax=Mesorhizobium sp. LHD-90 TaxID=3071414 RepID=UPI0027E0A62D|nr:NUDIX hydrolase [Mesorhizobium sp. LHD-90]MDQ6433067.1 NUDIX hydrolase [Mesorhizobium sp. LHD-90]
MFIGHSKRSFFADRVRRLLGGAPCRVQVAALPWRKGPDGVEIMLITSRDSGRWVLPKGWPEGDEALWDAAAREASEEAGIDGAIAQSEIGRYYYAKLQPSGAEKRCEVRVFPMEIDEVKDKWPERRQRKRQWFSPLEAARSVREQDLADLIARFSTNPRRSAA